MAAGWQRLIGWALAGQAAAGAELASRRGWSAEHTAAASELGAHLGVPDGEANKIMARGAGLSTHAAVAHALVAGRIEVVKADLLLFAEMGPLQGHIVPQVLVWPVYYLGQLLIATGVAQTLRKRDPELRIVVNNN